MITKVEVRTSVGMLLTLLLDDISSGYVVESIDGLDPVKATLVSSSFASLDGAQYQSSRRETRNILLTLGLEPDYVDTSVRDLRTQLYQYFMPKSEVQLRFYLEDDFTVNITGRVESFESTLFSQEPKIVISLICFDPDFTEVNSDQISDNSVSDSTEIMFNYDGTVETGFTFNLYVDRDLSEFTIYLRGPDDVVRSMDFAAELEDGDTLSVSTLVGQKAITLNRGGTESSLLYALSPQSNWLEIFPGDNNLRIYATGDPIAFDLTYTDRHGGL